MPNSLINVRLQHWGKAVRRNSALYASSGANGPDAAIERDVDSNPEGIAGKLPFIAYLCAPVAEPTQVLPLIE